jgi:hypothetical protein
VARLEPWQRDLVELLAEHPECIDEWQRIVKEDEDEDRRSRARAALKIVFASEDSVDSE